MQHCGDSIQVEDRLEKGLLIYFIQASNPSFAFQLGSVLVLLQGVDDGICFQLSEDQGLLPG